MQVEGKPDSQPGRAQMNRNEVAETRKSSFSGLRGAIGFHMADKMNHLYVHGKKQTQRRG